MNKYFLDFDVQDGVWVIVGGNGRWQAGYHKPHIDAIVRRLNESLDRKRTPVLKVQPAKNYEPDINGKHFVHLWIDWDDGEGPLIEAVYVDGRTAMRLAKVKIDDDVVHQ